MNLTIESVEAIALAATWDKVYGGWDRVPESLLHPASSHRALPRRGQYTVLVRVRTTEGLEGIGEAYGLPAPEVPATVIGKILAPPLLGQDAGATTAIWETHYGAQQGAGRTGGFYLEAIGGITEVWRIAALCHAFHVDIAPHGVGSGINIAAALQLAAAVPNCAIYEYNQLPNPLRHGLLATPLQFADGCLHVPEGPGLGIALNEDAVREYAVMRA